MAGVQLIFGKECTHVSKIVDTLNEAAQSQFDFVVVPLFHPRLRRDVVGTSSRRQGPITRSDRELESKDWQANVVGYCSEWCDLENPSDAIRKASEECMRQECSWASHLGLQAIVLPVPR